MIKLIVAGPRDYHDQEKVFRYIHMFQGKFGIDEIYIRWSIWGR